MADLTYIDRDLEVKIVGQDSTGNRANYVSASATGSLQIAGEGISGTPSGGVVSVQGVVGGTAQPVSQSAGPWTINITQVGGSAVALGQTTMASSFPVTIASNQSALAVSQSTSPWLTQDAADGSVTPGTVATKSILGGMQYNTTSPAPTNGQQLALQSTDSGRLKVDATITGIGTNVVASYSSKIRADIYTGPNIAVSSAVTYTTLYTYSGTGFLIGFNVEFNGVNVIVKLTIDSEIIFDGVDLSTFNGFLVTADAQYRRQLGSGIVTQSSSLDWSLKQPVSFLSNVTISARLSGGTSKNYQQGIVYIDKVT